MKKELHKRAEEIMEECREQGCYIDYDEAINIAEQEMKINGY